MSAISSQSTDAVYEMLRKEARAVEFTVADVVQYWKGTSSVLRTAIRTLAMDGRLTRTGTAKSQGAPGIYALTEDLEALTAPDKSKEDDMSRKRPGVKAVVGGTVSTELRTPEESVPRVTVVLNAKDDSRVNFTKEFNAVLGMHDVGTLGIYLEALEGELLAMRRVLTRAEKFEEFVIERNAKLDDVLRSQAAVINELENFMKKSVNFDGRPKWIVADEALANDNDTMVKNFNELLAEVDKFKNDVAKDVAKLVRMVNESSRAALNATSDNGNLNFAQTFEQGFEAGIKFAMKRTSEGSGIIIDLR